MPPYLIQAIFNLWNSKHQTLTSSFVLIFQLLFSGWVLFTRMSDLPKQSVRFTTYVKTENGIAAVLAKLKTQLIANICRIEKPMFICIQTVRKFYCNNENRNISACWKKWRPPREFRGVNVFWKAPVYVLANRIENASRWRWLSLLHWIHWRYMFIE